jgi:deoxyribose-phosphate aldolase
MKINQYIDHTLLKPTALISEIEILCSEAKQFGFAAVCIPPPFVKKSKDILKDTGIKVATVIGFPLGYHAVESKIAEILLAIVDGADELDIVIILIALKNNDWEYLAGEINHMMPLIRQHKKIVKLIIESGVLTENEIIRCCELYGAAGVDYLKTSTGYAEKSASVESVRLIRQHLSPSVGIKASGGIKTYSFARQLIEAGATRIGSSAGVALIKDPANQVEGD